MSYTTRTRYTSRKEKAKKLSRNIRLIIVFGLIALAVWCFKERVMIWDYIRTSFY